MNANLKVNSTNASSASNKPNDLLSIQSNSVGFASGSDLDTDLEEEKKQAVKHKMIEGE